MLQSSKSPTSVYVGVNDIGIHIINAQTKVRSTIQYTASFIVSQICTVVC